MRNLHRVILCTTLAAGIGACSSIQPSSPAPGGEAAAYGDFLSARLAASNHNITDAARLYRASLDTAPDNADLLNDAFFFTAAGGNIEQAASYAERVLSSEPDNRAARLLLTTTALKHGDYSGARSEVAQSAKGPFTTLTLLLLDAWSATGAGDTDAAMSDLKEVPSQGGTDALANFHRALILDLAGRNADADAAYRASMSANGTSPRVVEAYGRFLERTASVQDARKFYQRMISDDAVAPIAVQGLARLDTGSKPERMVATPAQGAAEALFGIAASLSDESSADIAILYLRLALYLAPDQDLAKIVLADRLENLNKFDDAVAVYRSMNHDSPYWSAAAVQTALDESRIGRNDQAIAELEAICKADPANVTAWTALGDVYRSANKFDEASGAYDRAVALLRPEQSKDWAIFYARAAAESQDKRWDAAEQDLQHALKLSPDQPQVLNFLGYSWVDQGRRIPEALALLEKARALSPFDGYIVDSVGWAYYRLGRYPDAAKTLESAVLLVPGDSTINDHLGDAYWKVGRKLEARFQWSHALAFGPDAGEKAKIEAKLRSGLDDSSSKH